ncbi:VrrA/YqfQ family protein [Piscibacillus halophilus]|uniref:VrrA/YqfQ family protein n=1 Tax=Piscibacillus halophilus TaxID=571933 RepID=UPI0024094501|nr:VrrA/YqfQ family protein [Piscibacillus halophilus]
MNPFDFQSPMDHQWHQYPHYHQPFFQPMPQKKGLNRIFHNLLGKNQVGPFSQTSFGAGPGMASKYAQLYETLNHVQKGLGIIQQVSPYIKQYGPFVKNFPMFIDMVKIMMENDEEEGEEKVETEDFQPVTEDEDQIDKVKETEREEKPETHRSKTPTQNKRKSKNIKGESEFPRPKLYI